MGIKLEIELFFFNVCSENLYPQNFRLKIILSNSLKENFMKNTYEFHEKIFIQLITNFYLENFKRNRANFQA
jgi:hypothetical protein